MDLVNIGQLKYVPLMVHIMNTYEDLQVTMGLPYFRDCFSRDCGLAF